MFSHSDRMEEDKDDLRMHATLSRVGQHLPKSFPSERFQAMPERKLTPLSPMQKLRIDMLLRNEDPSVFNSVLETNAKSQASAHSRNGVSGRLKSLVQLKNNMKTQLKDPWLNNYDKDDGHQIGVLLKHLDKDIKLADKELSPRIRHIRSRALREWEDTAE